MNEFDDLDDLEREFGPLVRVALHRAAARVTADPQEGFPAVLENEDAVASIVDVRSKSAKRSGRRRWLVIAAAAVAVVVVAVTVLVQRTGDEGTQIKAPAGPSPTVTTVPPRPPSGSTDPGLGALMLTESATPSTPETGTLIASMDGPGSIGYSLYADGRLIWLDEADGTQGWLERGLTPDGVERVRAEFLATGLFDPGQPVQKYRSSRDGLAFCACVRDGGFLLGRNVRDLQIAAPLLVDQLGAVPSSRPVTDWADQQSNAYVPSKYGICLNGRDAGYPARVDPTVALEVLPARATRLLGGREAVLDFGPLDSCLEVATARARALADELLAAGYVVDSCVMCAADWGFSVEERVDQPHLKKISLVFMQSLPDGSRPYGG